MRHIAAALLFAIAGFAASDREKLLDSIFADFSAPNAPGCAVGVLERGQAAFAKGYGLADLEHRIPISPRSRFYAASIAKQFTALAALIAEREGKWKLDDSIRKYVPELPHYADAITIRRMLDHTAGLRDFLPLWSLRGFSNESVLREDATLRMIVRQKALTFAPGTDQSYSNTGYLLTAIALKRAAGVPLDGYAREKIFAPLGMNASRFQADHGEPVPDRAHGYHRRDGGWKGVDIAFDLIGGGGMYSNVEDMLRWARNFETPTAGNGLLGTLQTPGRLADGRRTPGGYALGIIEKDGTYSHSSAAAGYSTEFIRVPKHGLAVVCLCNAGSAPAGALAAKVVSVFTGEPAPPVSPAAKPPATEPWQPGETARLTGTYWSEELRTVWELRQRDGGLWLHGDGIPVEIRRGTDGIYRAGPLEIKAVDSGLQAGIGRTSGIEFTRR